MKIEVAIQTHYFQRRLCWMLSSILQQVGIREGDSVSCSIAYAEGTGNPTTEAVISHFRLKGMEIRAVPYEGIDRFQYRGLTRNDQLSCTDADWILFADSDMVYPVNFFAEAFRLLRTPDYMNSSRCLYSRRFSTGLEPTCIMVGRHSYPTVVPDAYAKAAVLEGELKANIGAGYCQLANVDLLRDEHGGRYQLEDAGLDRSWAKGQKAHSDRQFRKRLGRQAIPLPVQIHLQHIRDNELGRHTEEQR